MAIANAGKIFRWVLPLAIAACDLSPIPASTDAAPMCATDSDCDDGNPCTADQCADGICNNLPVTMGTPCTGPDACAAACNGLGQCSCEQ